VVGLGPIPKALFDVTEKAAKIANTTKTINAARNRAFIGGTLLFFLLWDSVTKVFGSAFRGGRERGMSIPFIPDFSMIY
jgi:hypothetical protein